jgi:hypothetical protein
MQVDDPRSDNEAARIEHLLRITTLELTDFGDDTVFDANIGLIGREQRSIDDRTAFNNGIELRHN